MAKNLTLKDCDAERADMLYREIQKVRFWITGFEAAGKAGPPDEALRQMQIILKDSIAASRTSSKS